MVELLLSPVAMRENTLLRTANEDDWGWMDSLRKKEGSSLGFIPKDAYLSVLTRSRIHNRDRWRYQQILITEDNGDRTGFIYASFHAPLVKIIQIVVQQDARRWHRALLMVDYIESVAKTQQKAGLTCRVAYDLEANFFWRAIGYLPITTEISTWLNQRESRSKRPIIVYEKNL